MFSVPAQVCAVGHVHRSWHAHIPVGDPALRPRSWIYILDIYVPTSGMHACLHVVQWLQKSPQTLATKWGQTISITEA